MYMNTGFYQLNPVFGDKEANFLNVATAVKGEDFDLLVLPEFFSSGYQFVSQDEVADLAEEIPDGATTQFLIKISKEKNAYIVAGLPERVGNTFY